MTPVETSRICCACKKVFCCAACRERHEKKKHPKRQPNCPFCISKKLPLKSFEDKALFCHIVFAHLPLYCYLCGEIFQQSKDLESFGACKWWNSWHRHSLVPEQKSLLGTPPFDADGKQLIEYNGNFKALTSPPELYRNTSTPMLLCQKSNFNFKTPIVPNFTLKTPNTNSASMSKNPTYSLAQVSASSSNDSSSKYMSFPSATSHEETPCRILHSNSENKKELTRNSFRNLDTAKGQGNKMRNECYTDNNSVADMDLTNVESEALPDSQSLEICQPEKRSDASKKVRFSDEHVCLSEPSSTSNFNTTENEEYFEACDTLSEMRQSLERTQIKIYEDNAKNTEKENRGPDRNDANGSQQSSGSSRVVMMVVVESNSTVPTSDLIDTGLKKLERATSSTHQSVHSPTCSSLITSIDSYYSASASNLCSPAGESGSLAGRSMNSTANSNTSHETYTTGGILSAMANAVRNVMRNLPGMGSSRHIEREPISSRIGIIPTSSTSHNFSSASSLTSSVLQTSGKRSRDAMESSPSTQRQVGRVLPQTDIRSPVAKRHRGWYKIKGREPIARMRNNRQLTSPRGVSSETQVFHQGSLSVGDTVLPLPDRAHQSTQTE